MMNLFGDIVTKPEVIRTLCFYQPFGSLMLHGKVETRFVRKGRKPPFPLGKYLFYTTKVPCNNAKLFNWCGPEIMAEITNTLNNDSTKVLNGYAIAIGELTKIVKLTPETKNTFVKFIGEKTEIIKDESVTKTQWGLYFENVQAIEPFIWNHGKQGVGIVPKEELTKILITTNSMELKN